ncbi:hypothetical protein H2201_004573 [Coniosporium apollinis]|uniref:Uncharacterized protein n=2 Tax=Coniosporium TaxID=2810619 RepID=A0ABQ9NSF4_9PEZI|nr:hypothetical protein H2199_006762 [Cladosporium sp. JES 115]KAJ9665281.1 hypothetical protein H2201_004573 [Coniosporium apollinis]
MASDADSWKTPGRLRDTSPAIEDKSYVPSHCTEHEAMKGYGIECEGLNAKQDQAYCAAGDVSKARDVADAIKAARAEERLGAAGCGYTGAKKQCRKVRFDDSQVHRSESEYRFQKQYKRKSEYYLPDPPISREEKQSVKVERYDRVASHAVTVRGFEFSQEAELVATEDVEMVDASTADEGECHMEELVGDALESYLIQQGLVRSDDILEVEF